MKKLLAASAAMAVVLGGSASAATYVSYFDHSNTGSGGDVVKRAGTIGESNAWGKVTIEEGTDMLTVTVSLFGELAGFLNTGSGPIGNKSPFTFNLTSAVPASDIDIDNSNDPNPSDGAGHDQDFFYGGHGTFGNTPFGDFNDYIGCCNSIDNIKNGSNQAAPPPLVFTISKLGATFANTLTSNTNGATAPGATEDGGWWFAADVTTSFDSGSTFTIAARDVACVDGCGGSNTSVPEPTTWALMIMGFGGAGAMIRRRRSMLA